MPVHFFATVSTIYIFTWRKLNSSKYQGTVQSIDDTHDTINDALCGLIIPRKVAEELVSENKFYILEISIESLKLKNVDTN